MSGFEGKWKLVESENFDDYMKAIGVPMTTRAAAAVIKPNQVITVNGDTVTIKTISTLKTAEVTFTFGQEFEETTLDDKKLKSTVTKESDTKWVQHSQGTPERTTIREIIGDAYVLTLEAGGVTAKRTYHRE